MEIIDLASDIKVLYITATSFPEGIPEAHQKLHALVPFSAKRKYFGISRPENGPVVYRAAAETTSGEVAQSGCETLILSKGKYISLTVKDYAKDIESIDRAFKQLLEYPGLDPQGYCVEWYINDKDVQCMIRLQP